MENKYDDENPKPNDGQPNDDKDQSGWESAESDQKNHDWKTIEEDPTKIKIEKNPGELVSGMFQFIKNTLSLRHGKYNYKEVVAVAEESVLFQGYNVWILICSIVVASIGLDMGSIPVVIGAMLISPLMGPIRGIGFGVGINDLALLKSSVKNFGVMVGVSLVTSIVYFLLSPTDIANSELLGRTEPTFLDAMIAFFGGLSGIIAASNGKNDTVIPGVAIATALMPPLCTAGWGIANGEWACFLGASYLFLLNSLFIALSTVILLRYLKFPKREYISGKIEKKVQNYIIIFMVLVIAPSAYLFYKMAKRSSFEANTALFVEEVVKEYETNMLVTPNPIFDWNESVIELAVVNAYIDSSTLGSWNRQKERFDLDFAEIKIIQGEDLVAMTDRKIKEALGLSGNQNELINMLKEKELLISDLQGRFKNYQATEDAKKDHLDLNHLLTGFKVEYPEINNLAVNKSYSVNGRNEMDTTYIITVNFKPNVDQVEQEKLKSRINRKFCFELKASNGVELDSVSVVNY
ncbi:MAG: putative hydrophobic protein (TIGR00271 family) [Crocinitomix sp.]|jgi:uncharacterized hydrophobic protein (TIGR00271 family)